MNLQDRFYGAMLGLAAGDAVGTTLEFTAPNSFAPIQDMVGGGPFNLQAGEWTDDTSMALCLADSLIICQGFDPTDQMTRYMRWFKDGYMSSNGRCFDIGNTVVGALRRFKQDGEPYAGSTDKYSAGNGSLMRLAPIPLFYAHNPEEAIHYAGESSRTTHGAQACVDACRYYAGLILGALQGASKAQLLSDHYTPLTEQSTPYVAEVAQIASGSFKEKEPPDIRGTGYVVQSLEAALWAFERSNTFREGVLLSANLGEDADTTAAIYGQLAGAYYGVQAIPVEWLNKLALRDTLNQLTEGLYQHSTPKM